MTRSSTPMLLPSHAPRRMRDRSSALCQGFGVAWTSGPRCGVRLALAWVADGCARASKTDGGVCLCAARFGPSSAPLRLCAAYAGTSARWHNTSGVAPRLRSPGHARGATAADFCAQIDEIQIVRVRSTIDVIETNEEERGPPPLWLFSFT